MQFSVYADYMGEVDTRCHPFSDHLFLLSRKGEVLGSRSGLFKPVIGQSFFDAFPAPPAELSELSASLNGFAEDTFLMRCKKTPVAVFRSLFGKTGMLLLSVPAQDTAALMQSPACLCEPIEHLAVSKGLQETVAPITEEVYQAAIQWLWPYHVPLFADEPLGSDADDLIFAIALRADRIARLCGCHLIYDLRGLGFLPIPHHDLTSLMGFLFAACLAARRATKEHSLRLFIDRDTFDGPALHAVFDLLDKNDPLQEFRTLSIAAKMRGFELLAMHHKENVLEILWPICYRELAVQGFKHPPLRLIDDMSPNEIHWTDLPDGMGEAEQLYESGSFPLPREIIESNDKEELGSTETPE